MSELSATLAMQILMTKTSIVAAHLEREFQFLQVNILTKRRTEYGALNVQRYQLIETLMHLHHIGIQAM